MSASRPVTLSGIITIEHRKPILVSAPFGNKYYLTETRRFDIGDTVIVSRYLTQQYRYDNQVFYVQTISEYECCRSEYRGDANDNGVLNLADLIMFAGFLNRNGYLMTYCVSSLDCNDDTIVDEADLDYLLFCGAEPAVCE